MNHEVYSVNMLIMFSLKCLSDASLNGLNNAGTKMKKEEESQKPLKLCDILLTSDNYHLVSSFAIQ